MKTEDQLWEELIGAYIKAMDAKHAFVQADKAYSKFMAEQKFLRAWLRGEL